MGVRGQSGLSAHHDGIFLIFDLYQANSLFDGQSVSGDENSDFVSMVADVAGQQTPVGDVGVVGIEGLGMPGGSEPPIRYVFVSENGYHAVKISGLIGVYG